MFSVVCCGAHCNCGCKRSKTDRQSFCMLYSTTSHGTGPVYSRCNEIGGHLVTLPSQEEVDLVASTPLGSALVDIWLGARDATVEGEWRWEDSGELVSNSWLAGEPTNTSEDMDCLTVAFRSRGFRSRQCSDICYCLCEITL